MTVYVTKTWGFSSPCGPLQFSQRGWRDRARAMLAPGDLGVIVGTMGDETLDEERGRSGSNYCTLGDFGIHCRAAPKPALLHFV